MRKKRLRDDPLCVRCMEAGDVVEAAVVDHIIPHRGSKRLFYDYANTQSLCSPCHDRGKQREEVAGFDRRVGTNGWPTDPRHPANRGR